LADLLLAARLGRRRNLARTLWLALLLQRRGWLADDGAWGRRRDWTRERDTRGRLLLGLAGLRRRSGCSAAALLFAGKFFDGDFAREDVTGELAGIAWDVGHGDLGVTRMGRV
jgi:hypothetical protein